MVIKRDIKIMLVALLVLVIAVPSILAWSSLTQRFILSSSLHVTDFVKKLENACASNATDSSRDIAHIYARIENPRPNSNRIPILYNLRQSIAS